MPTLIILVAYAIENRAIGVNNTLPWHLPGDLKRFKTLTMGKPIIMGRKTWESIGRPLPGRRNIIITRQQNLSAEGADVVNSLDAAIGLAFEHSDTAFVIGGEQIYAQAIEKSQQVMATEIHQGVDGDAFFPDLDEKLWRETSRDAQPEENGMNYDYVVYERIPKDLQQNQVSIP